MNYKKISLFLLITFALSWSVSLLMYGFNISYTAPVAKIIVALFYMPAPAVSAIIVQKYLYKGKLSDYQLSLRGLSFKWLLLAPVVTLWIILVSLLLNYLLGNVLGIQPFGYVDFSKGALVEKLAALANIPIQESQIPISTGMIFIIGLLSGVTLGGITNFPFALGEELGWRGFLLNETRALGYVKSSLLIGIIWGVWHTPLIIQGHNYPGYPYAGVAMMVLFTTGLSFLMSYLRHKANSLWSAVLLHGMINATASLVSLFTYHANPLVGSVAGISGIFSILLLVATTLLFDKSIIKRTEKLVW